MVIAICLEILIAILQNECETLLLALFVGVTWKSFFASESLLVIHERSQLHVWYIHCTL